MRFNKIECEGKFLLDVRSAAGVTGNEQGRFLYDSDFDLLKFNDGGGFITLFDNAHDIIPDTPDTYKIGDNGSEFQEVWVNQLTIPVGGGPSNNYANIDAIIGNIYASDFSTQILENGSDGTNGWFRGNIRSDDNSVCLNSGSTPSAATFTGTATKAKYA